MKNKQFRSLVSKACAVFAVTTMMASVAWATGGYKKVYSFTGGIDGSDPATRLTFDSAGNAYGTTAAGGEFDLGAGRQSAEISRKSA